MPPSTKHEPRGLTALLLVLVITFICFSSVLDNGFTNWDDDVYLLKNTSVRYLNLKNIHSIFTESILGTYSPLNQLSYALEYALAGYDPFVYHMNNLILHLGVVALAFLFSRQCGLTVMAAGFAALLFGIHPLHVESVAWIVERKDVLYAFFYMAALCAYLRYLDKGQKRFYLAALVLGLLSILSKAMALSLPLVLLACDHLKGRKLSKQVLLEKLPFLLIIVPVALVTYFQNARLPFAGRLAEPLLLWMWTFTFYIKKFLFPFTLVPVYPAPPQPVAFMNPHYFLNVIFFVALVFLVIRYRHKKLFVFSFLFYICSMFFLFRFDRQGDVSFVADRFMYLPCLGFCMFMGSGLDKGRRTMGQRRFLVKLLLVGLTSGLFAALSVKTFLQNNVWQDSITLWQYVVEKSPRQARAYDNLASAHIEAGNYDIALSLLKTAAELEINKKERLANLGFLYQKLGQADMAEQALTAALALDPGYYIALNNLGLVLKDSGRADEAEALFHRAIQSNGNAFEPRLNLALISQGKGNVLKAAELYQDNLAVDPLDTRSLGGLLDLYFSSGQRDKASSLGLKILQLDRQAKSLTEFGSYFAKQQLVTIAHDLFVKAIKLEPRYPESYLELGKLWGNSEQFDKAIATWKKGSLIAAQDPRFQALIGQAEELKRTASMTPQAE